MNIINIILATAKAKTNTTVPSDVLELRKGTYHAFDINGEYVDRIKIEEPTERTLNFIRNRYKQHLIIEGHPHKGEWRHYWFYVNADAKVINGTELEADYTAWARAISPTNRKPWYWERKIAKLKLEYPHWDTDLNEGVNIRIECREILAELETNFNINSSYYRMQSNAAQEAYGIILTVDSQVDAFEHDMNRMDNILAQREASNWNDERDDLDM